MKASSINSSTLRVLQQCLGVNSNVEAFRQLARLHDLVDEVILFAHAESGLPRSSIDKYIPTIRSALTFSNLDAPWGNYAHNINSNVLVALDMIASSDHVKQDGSISEEELSDLGEEIEILFNSIASNFELPREFREFLLRQLELMRRAVQEFRITGAGGFTKYLESLVAERIRNGDELKAQAAKSPEASGRFLAILSKFSDLSSRTVKGAKLLMNLKRNGEELIKMLPDNSTADGVVPELTTSVDVG